MDTAKIFKNGRSQAVRLPKACRLEGKEVCVAKLDDIVILYPPGKGWELMEKAIDGFTKDYMTRRDEPRRAQRRARL